MGIFSPVIREHLARVSHYAQGRLLDVGCGNKPHRAVFAAVDAYIGIDRPSEAYENYTRIADRKAAIDVIASAEAIPFKDSSFDTVIAVQLIEHLAEPQVFFSEGVRVLRCGGALIITFPLINQVHEQPYDFFRYTEFGVRYLCQKVGLEVVEVVPMGGGWLTVGYLVRFLLDTSAQKKGGGLGRTIRQSMGLIIYQFLSRWDQSHPHPECPLNYLLVAKKPLNCKS